jgi:hypothetical protein
MEVGTMGAGADKKAEKKDEKKKVSKGGRAKKAAGEEKDGTGDAATERFVQDVLVRGEAEKPTAGGTLPKNATHAIVEEKPDGTAKIKRARFKAF